MRTTLEQQASNLFVVDQKAAKGKSTIKFGTSFSCDF